MSREEGSVVMVVVVMMVVTVAWPVVASSGAGKNGLEADRRATAPRRTAPAVVGPQALDGAAASAMTMAAAW